MKNRPTIKNNTFIKIVSFLLFIYSIVYCENQGQSNYILTVGDKIQITYTDIDANGNIINKGDIFTLKNDGSINHPLLGVILLKNQSISSAESTILSLMEKYFTNPNVSITIFERNTIQVLLYGAVANSGMFNINPQTSIAEFVLGTGKLNQEADLTNIQIVTDKDSTVIFNLTNFLYNNDKTNNILLDNGYKVIVPTYTDRNFANILSENYLLKKGNVIKVAIFENSNGTMNETEPDILTIDDQGFIYHNLLGRMHIGGMTIKNAEEQIRKDAMNYYQEPIVKINVVSINKRVVYVFGEVPNQGFHPLIGSVRIAEFLAKSAGGLSTNADLKKILITRENGETIKFNFKDYLYKRKDKQNVLLQDGDRIIVLSKNRGFLYTTSEKLRNFYYLIQFIATGLSIYLISKQL